MELHLTDEEGDQLSLLLDQVLAELSYEISGTDRADYRKGLRGRRDSLAAIRDRLRHTSVGHAGH